MYIKRARQRSFQSAMRRCAFCGEQLVCAGGERALRSRWRGGCLAAPFADSAVEALVDCSYSLAEIDLVAAGANGNRYVDNAGSPDS
jgi:hypothetical protein